MLPGQFFQGFCMAMADSVPGVSGGTIAYLMGFYNKFINSISDIISTDKTRRKEAWSFLIRLAVGWVAGMAIAVTVLSSLFSVGIYEVSSLFLGFILASIIVLFITERSVLLDRPVHLIWTAAGALLVVAVTAAGRHTMSGTIDLASITPGQGLYIFFAAAVAICAMVLPGISGSTLLLIFGLYLPVVTAAKDVLHMNFSTLPALLIFAAGIITGILLCARGIRRLMNRYPAAMMHAIVGMMIGSIWSVIQGPLTLKVPKPAMTFSTFRPLLFVIGALLVLLLERYRKAGKKQTAKAV